MLFWLVECYVGGTGPIHIFSLAMLTDRIVLSHMLLATFSLLLGHGMQFTAGMADGDEWFILHFNPYVCLQPICGDVTWVPKLLYCCNASSSFPLHRDAQTV